tara:strand:+ start:4981 stop:5739 length:759 start_codon:yes stop_codon:yes gene_type:complete
MKETAPTPFELQKLTVPSGSSGAFFNIERLAGDVAERELDVAIAYDSGPRRTFYATSIEDGDGGPPHCSSSDGKIGFGVRDVSAISAAGDEWGSLTKTSCACAECPFSKFDSSLRGRSSQACSQSRLIVIFDPQSTLPMMLQVSPGSLRNFRKYQLRLAGGDAKLSECVTTIGLEKVTGSPDYYALTFKFKRELEELEVERLGQLAQVMVEAIGDSDARSSGPAASAEQEEPVVAVDLGADLPEDSEYEPLD